MAKTGDYFKYGIANGIYGVFDGADTLEEVKEIIKEKYEDEPELHVVRLDPESGEVKAIVICDFREKA